MSTRLLIPGTLEALRDEVCAALEARGHEPLFMGPVEDADIVCGQGYVDNDVCAAGIAAIGQTIRWISSHEGIYDVLACEICKDCRSLSMAALLPDALHRANLEFGDVFEFSCADLAGAAGTLHTEEADGERPLVGVCGNAAMLASPLFTRTVANRLRSSGCTPVTPPLGLLVNERDFLSPALEWFSRNGVRTVVCILAFGCLGGHAFARGQARRLREEWPHVEFTILDYDRDGSDINLVNRIELVIQSALGHD